MDYAAFHHEKMSILMPMFAQVSAAPDYWPFVVLAVSVGLIVLLITVVRLHAFMALILAALAAGLLAKRLPGQPEKSHWTQAIELTLTEFGTTAGRIGVVIALAAVIGMCLMESGAADKVVRRFLAFFGEKRAAFAILISGYILSIPIFFDTFFMLLLPLAVAMHLRTGKDYLLYVMAICAGGTVTHSLVAPHPGPLAMAESLRLDLGLTIIVGTAVGIIPALCSFAAVKAVNRRMTVPFRESGTLSVAAVRANMDRPESELPGFIPAILPVILPIVLISLASTFIAVQTKGFEAGDFTDLPGIAARLRAPAPPGGVGAALQSGVSAALVERLAAQGGGSAGLVGALATELSGDLNKVLRGKPLPSGAASGIGARGAETLRLEAAGAEGGNLVRLNRCLIEDYLSGLVRRSSGLSPAGFNAMVFWGDRNVALMIGAVIAMAVLMRQRGLKVSKICEMIGPPFETAGVIILITSAGGAFGLMLKNAGVGDAVKSLVEGRDVNLILLSWVVAAVIRVAQGSATVAMLTTAAMIYPLMTSATLPFHPVYLFLSIGFGAMFLSWMNDSGFWVVGRLSGLTEEETLKSWTVVVTVNSVVGLVVCLVLSSLLPMVPR